MFSSSLEIYPLWIISSTLRRERLKAERVPIMVRTTNATAIAQLFSRSDGSVFGEVTIAVNKAKNDHYSVYGNESSTGSLFGCWPS